MIASLVRCPVPDCRAKRTWLILASGPVLLALAGCGDQREQARGQPRDSIREESPALAAPTSAIAFVSNRDGNSEIYLMNGEGSGLRNLTNHPADDAEPAWSPDGSRLAFVSNRDDNNEIYVVNAAGSGLRKLTNNRADDRSPVWSPDGTRLAFERYVSEEVQGDEGQPSTSVSVAVHVMNADGSQSRKLTNRTDPDDRPSWSPDGTRLAFLSDRDGRRGLYIASADGSGLMHLSNSPESFAWSPDGRRLAFVTSGGPGDRDLYIVNADGSGLTRYSYAIEPAWSPDGTMLAFARLAPGGSHPGGERIPNLDIFVMNADCSALSQLTEDRNYPNYNDRSPIWLPANQQSSTQAPTGGARP